jgi:mRNA-degrading endonuclease RelE of RelBE toxin-antitoxin system
MAYSLVFTRDARHALDILERTERSAVTRKLNEISACEFRHPSQWDFERLPGLADGRFRIGNSLRVFADIDETDGLIRVHDVRRRENLYA